MTNNSKLHSRYALSCQFNERKCGCITRGDGQQLRYCQLHRRMSVEAAQHLKSAQDIAA